AAHITRRPLDLLPARTLVTQPCDLLEQDATRLRLVRRRRREVDGEGAARDLVVVEGVHGVRQSPLAAHFLEEPPTQARGHRLDDVEREALGGLEPWRGEADHLRGLLPP